MSVTSIPGFTAVSSLYRSKMNYLASMKSSPPLRSLFLPAQSDVFNPDRQIPSLSSGVYHPHPTWCLKIHCIYDPARSRPFCWQAVGFWDPVTQSCV
jgi:hypothetical protein